MVESVEWMRVANAVRSEVFGFSSWRGEQEAVLRAVGKGENLLAVMPTGMGKSLCYQVPARIFSKQTPPGSGPRLVLVVSPLIALMKDQVDAARSKGLKAAAINSSLSREERERVLIDVAAGKIELLYATPERLRQEVFWDAVRTGGGVRLLAIDEAHCISTWGHDFRLDYSRLGDYVERLGRPQILALTATATSETQDDILSQLQIPNAARVISSVWRGNLAIEVHDVHGLDEKVRAFTAFRHFQPGPAIVYFALIQTLRKFSDEISRLGFEHTVYHGQLADRQRKRGQEDFLQGRSEVMLATPAFGLGVDKPDVRLLMHAELPGSMEAYYQEIGRAGRDGKPSKCVALYDRDDVSLQRDFVKWAHPDPGFIQSVLNLIERNELRARQEGFDYLRAQMNFYNSRDYRVETAVGLLERWGALEGREPREWKVVGPVPTEYLDQERFKANLRRRETKLERLSAFFEETPQEARCRLASVAASFGEDVGTGQNAKKCGVCDACVAVS